MGNIYAGMSVGFGFILFCIVLSLIWVVFRNYKKRILPQKNPIDVINFFNGGKDKEQKSNRTEISWPVLLETNKGIIKAETKDLNLGGAFVKCSKPLLPGEQFRLLIEFPSKNTVALKSEVVWSNTGTPDEMIITRGMCVRFLQNVDEDLDYLKSALEEYMESIKMSPVQCNAFI